MNILITTDAKGGTARLITDSPASRYGIPVLQIDADDVSGDFGPSDLIGGTGKIPIMTAASIVAGWAMQPKRTDEERHTAYLFLRQWPEGPQINPSIRGRPSLGTSGDSKTINIRLQKSVYDLIPTPKSRWIRDLIVQSLQS